MFWVFCFKDFECFFWCCFLDVFVDILLEFVLLSWCFAVDLFWVFCFKGFCNCVFLLVLNNKRF